MRSRPVITRVALRAVAAAVALAALAPVPAPAAGPAQRACYGAAAHDPAHPCSNRTRTVRPVLGSPSNQPSTGDCRLLHEEPAPVCTFGVAARRARAHVALVGDSHALHWRAALEPIARRLRWRGYSVTTSGCIYSTAERYLAQGFGDVCSPWYREARTWFARHPDVSTVFVSQFATNPQNLPLALPPGVTYDAAKTTGFEQAWRELPKTVRHIVVIHDVPHTTYAARKCVRAVAAAGRRQPGPACALPRADAVRWDAAVAAVTALHSPRYASIDLTDFFCDATRCEPVIGGVRVYADDDHMTAAYARTLAPYLERRLRVLMARW